MQIENLIVREDIPVYEEKDEDYYDGKNNFLCKNIAGKIRRLIC